MNLAELIADPRVIEDALGGGCFARIDMRHDPDVAGLLERNGSCHFFTLLRPEKKEADNPPPFHQSHFPTNLPAIMRKGPIGLCHPMGVFLLLNRCAAIIRGIDQLRRQFFLHRLFCAFTSRIDQPAHAQ